ncbi:MAG TPA: biotin--[acetyl-CoA-carboxylase] ligase [Thermodesulfobacteriaceae bacterium]|nr:biotin--[acetyl-CoA-carboxylase] ligase [Thermodesulfobacteriaceae bacterium]
MSRNLQQAEILKTLLSHYRVRDAALGSCESLPGAGDAVRRRASVIGSEIFCLDETARLMSLAKQAICEQDRLGRDLPTGWIWQAKTLSGAKGRMSRIWWAPPGGIYFCLEIFPGLLPDNWSLYNLGIGVAICQVLREWGVPARVRWINDVLIGGRKVAGVLSEAVFAPVSGQTYLIFGVGVNVNVTNFPDHLSAATSLRMETGCSWPLESLAAHIMARTGWIFGLVEQWEAESLLQDCMEVPNPVNRAWKLVSDTPGQRVRYGLDADRNPEIEAVVLDLDHDGGLWLMLGNGDELKVNSGEIRYVDPDA